MDEYIKREDAINAAKHAYNQWNLAMAAADGTREINMVYKQQELCKAVESVFADAPVSEVAPVVRCRECQETSKYRGVLMCCVWEREVKENDFCSRGERKEDIP